MTYTNISNSIVIVGVLSISVIALIKHIDDPLFWVAMTLAFIFAMWSWVQLDSEHNNERKQLIIERMKLENKKVELENKKIEIEVIRKKDEKKEVI